MELIAESNGASVFHAPWVELITKVPECNAIIVDTPYSARTHGGHDDGAEEVNKANERPDGGGRRRIVYPPWSPEDVRAFVQAWHPVCTGWFVTITDHVLAPVWSEALEAAGRYVFAPLPYVAPGSRVRFQGDGPSAWTYQIIAARPKTREFATWGTLPGAYILPGGMGEFIPIVGGKPSWLACRLCEHYSRRDDLVVDPCCGAGSLLVGAIRTGRRAVGGDVLREHADLAAQWIRNPHYGPPGREDRVDPRQLRLFGA